MTTIQAVYEKGVFRPIRQLVLSEGTRVEVRIPQSETPRDPKAVAAHLARIAASAPARSSSDTASADHDSFLYNESERP